MQFGALGGVQVSGGFLLLAVSALAGVLLVDELTEHRLRPGGSCCPHPVPQLLPSDLCHQSGVLPADCCAGAA